MAAGYGMLGHIGIGKESAWGTAVAASDYFVAMSESVSTEFDRYETTNIHGRMSAPDDEAGVERNGGDIVIPSQPVAMGWALAGVTGIQSNTVVLSGFLHKHEFTMATADDGDNNPVPPYTLEIFRDVTSSQRYAGAQFASVQIGNAPNQDLRLTASVIAKQVSELAKTTPSFPGSSVSPFTFDTASISIAGAASALVEAFTLSIDNQLEGIPTLANSTLIQKVRRTGFQRVALSMTIGFEDITDLERFRDQTEVAVKLNFTKAASFSLLIDIPRLVYRSFPLGMSDAGRQTVDIDGMARYHTGSAQAIKIDLTNTRSGY